MKEGITGRVAVTAALCAAALVGAKCKATTDTEHDDSGIERSGSGSSSESTSDTGQSGSSGSPLDGTWTIIDVTCGGQPATSALASFYTAPSSATEAFKGDTMVQTVIVGGCTSTYSWLAAVTTTTITLTPNGTSCSPSGCSAACAAGAPGDSYTYTVYDNKLTSTSTPGDLDSTCTSVGLSNPIVYTLTR
jgi:hypothetical protein